MHEIVTLQFGPRANYVGTHFWNTQDSYFTYDPAEPPSIVDHDINFRAGIGSDGSDTYTPRALVYDLKAGFGSLRRINALYEVGNDPMKNDIWQGGRKIHTTQPIDPSPYQVALESGLPTFQMQAKDVRYWSDFNRVYYHPRSLIHISNQSLTSQLSASESFSAGVDLFRDLDQETGGLLDRDVRTFAEECDSLQGFQVMGSSDDAWGGFMGKYVQELEEDFGKKSVWMWSMEDGQKTDRTKLFNRITNSTQTLASSLDYISANIRISSAPPTLPAYVHLKTGSLWDTGGLVASAIDSITLPLRLRSGTARGSRMASLEDFLGERGSRKLWDLKSQVEASFNGPMNADAAVNENPGNGTGASDSRLSAHQRAHELEESGHSDYPEASNFDIRFTPGMPQPQSVFPSLQDATHQRQSEAHVFAQIESHRRTITSQHGISGAAMEHERLRRLYNEETIVELFEIPLLFPLLDSFPGSLFNLPVQRSSGSDETSNRPNRRSNKPNSRSVSMRAALSTSSSTKSDLVAMRDLVVGRIGRAMNLVDSNEREALYEELTKVAEGYSHGYDGVDSDNDTEDY